MDTPGAEIAYANPADHIVLLYENGSPVFYSSIGSTPEDAINIARGILQRYTDKISKCEVIGNDAGARNLRVGVSVPVEKWLSALDYHGEQEK
jgi:hypothetical protein